MEAWIINEIEKVEVPERPRLELPLDYDVPQEEERVESEGKRGVIVIKLYDPDDDDLEE